MECGSITWNAEEIRKSRQYQYGKKYDIKNHPNRETKQGGDTMPRRNHPRRKEAKRTARRINRRNQRQNESRQRTQMEEYGFYE